MKLTTSELVPKGYIILKCEGKSVWTGEWDAIDPDADDNEVDEIVVNPADYAKWQEMLNHEGWLCTAQ